MTEYGRGTGPEPWHPDDPLYGDQAWTGHQAQHGQVPYEGAQQQHYYQQQQPQQQPQVPYYPQEQSAGQYHPQQPQYQDPQYQDQQYQDPQYRDQQYQDPQHAYGAQPQQAAPGQYHGDGTGGWDTGSWNTGAPDPYGAPQPAGYPAEAPDQYGTAEAYPPPQPPNRRHLVPEPAGEWQDEQAEDAGNAEAEEPEHAFFAGGGDDDGPDDDSGDRGGRGKRGGRGGRKQKSRSGVACLVVSLVLVGGVGGGGYFAYDFLKTKFGPAEDYAGEGTGSVEVEIKAGSGLYEMGNVLKAAGVVKSAEAFVSAAQENPRGTGIQPGLYTLKKTMSGQAAVEAMLSGTAQNVLMVNPGMRNTEVYKAIDKKLKQPEGTTAQVAKNQAKNLGLPAWADDNPKIKDPLEGFLFPQRYDLSAGATPEKLLKQMVAKASAQYQELGFDQAKAKSLGLDSPLQLVTVASLVQAEGMNHDDFRKMADVIYNRLKPTNDVTNRKLEFDSTINYAKGTSNIHVGRTEARTLEDPYNTYKHEGPPPGPIGNPGTDALNAALNPDKGGWMFFVSVDGKTTTFTKTFAEHEKLVAEFNKKHNNG
ncbi:endolytic transglycosylase MltG [Streptomyces sp. NPDC101132]|uniref:endolytic transglycosylase MltG n=1 Tax=Streptomyces sp. NPDC101132 TaxID=3366110 RepID=UPI0037F1BE80